MIDNKLQLDMAITACGLQETLKIKTFYYCVKKERKRKEAELERNGLIAIRTAQEGMVVAVLAGN